MNENEMEELFANINMIEDQIEQIEEPTLYDYVVNCITNNEWASMENYKDFIED